MGESEPDLTYHKPRPTFDRDLEKLGSIDRLSVFREQVGIIDVMELGPRASRRPAQNLGIYNRVATEEHKAKLQYYASALVINVCLLSQVIFASALTALGAGNGSHTQITALGAANTVIAAILTFTKGSGLPNRLRQYQCTLRKVREYIEQRERDFAQLDCQLDMDHEMKIIKGMYEQARQNDENNDPGTYHNPTAASTANGTVTGKIVANEPSSILGPNVHQPAAQVTHAVDTHDTPTNQPKTEEDLAHSEQTASDGVDRSATGVRCPNLVQRHSHIADSSNSWRPRAEKTLSGTGSPTPSPISWCRGGIHGSTIIELGVCLLGLDRVLVILNPYQGNRTLHWPLL